MEIRLDMLQIIVKSFKNAGFDAQIVQLSCAQLLSEENSMISAKDICPQLKYMKNITPCYTISDGLQLENHLPVSLPATGGCCTVWLVVLDEGGGANLPPGGGGRSPMPPELWGRDLSFFFDCWKQYNAGNQTLLDRSFRSHAGCSNCR